MKKFHLFNADLYMHKLLSATSFLLACFATSTAMSAPVYLNIDNISVAVGPGTSPGTFNNTFSSGQTIDKVIDAPTADAEEFHNQTTHIWFTADEVGGGLELIFDFGQEYDISTLHFWNYTAEGFDVDNVDFTFFNQSNVQVGVIVDTASFRLFSGYSCGRYCLGGTAERAIRNSFPDRHQPSG